MAQQMRASSNPDIHTRLLQITMYCANALIRWDSSQAVITKNRTRWCVVRTTVYDPMNH